MNEMNLKLQGIFNHLKQMGMPLSDDSFVHDIGTPKNEVVRNSCQSVDKQENFSNLKIPTLCRLWVIHFDKGKVDVAKGTIFPSSSQGNNMIHGKSIANNNVKVSVDDVVGKFQLTPLLVPCDEHQTVGDAAGSFVQWPEDLVTLGQDPIYVEKKKGHEMTPKKVGQIPK
ncbi:uncharacterized protein LOC141710931 [Apium graveolens]|uniref:uncharacterized protein LOC141710931 n=1 Tax=Apium graveolens TaxID=4045 RepID=UPI003D7B825B